MWENCSQSITLRSFINFSRTPCFSPSLSSFIKLSNSKEKQWTLSNTWPALTATFSHGHMMKKHLSNKRISFLSIMSLSSSEMWLFFMQQELWQRACVFVCVFICVCRADWTQIRGGVTGHSLIEQQPECDCCPSLSLSASLLTTYAFFLPSFSVFFSFFTTFLSVRATQRNEGLN